MGKQSAPQIPDPVKTIQAQTASNKETAISQAGLNAVNQNAPGGSSTWKQVGTWPDGTPRFEQTTSLDATGQQIFDTGRAAQLNLAGVARDQSARIGGLLSAPFSLDTEAEGRITDLANKRLDPQLAASRESKLTALANSGIKLGSTAYDRGVMQIDQAENDARNSLRLSARQQGVNEALAARNQPLNELLALSGQGQIAQPSFGSTPQTGVAGTDVAGITQSDYNNRMGQYNQQQQNNNSLIGGLFSLGSGLLLSDERAKENIRKIGETEDGQNIYEYNYKGSDETEIGLIAQEVEKKHPEAVQKIGGLLHVDYDKALEAA